MGDAIGRVTTTRRHEYVLTSPTNSVEVNKAVHWAEQELKAAKGEAAARWDDAISVQARDDQVVVFWDEEVPS